MDLGLWCWGFARIPWPNFAPWWASRRYARGWSADNSRAYPACILGCIPLASGIEFAITVAEEDVVAIVSSLCDVMRTVWDDGSALAGHMRLGRGMGGGGFMIRSSGACHGSGHGHGSAVTVYVPLMTVASCAPLWSRFCVGGVGLKRLTSRLSYPCERVTAQSCAVSGRGKGAPTESRRQRRFTAPQLTGCMRKGNERRDECLRHSYRMRPEELGPPGGRRGNSWAR